MASKFKLSYRTPPNIQNSCNIVTVPMYLWKRHKSYTWQTLQGCCHTPFQGVGVRVCTLHTKLTPLFLLYILFYSSLIYSLDVYNVNTYKRTWQQNSFFPSFFFAILFFISLATEWKCYQKLSTTKYICICRWMRNSSVNKLQFIQIRFLKIEILTECSHRQIHELW